MPSSKSRSETNVQLPMLTQSAIPDFYYAVFAFYEPALCLMGFVGAFFDPKTVCPLLLESNAYS
jgi:hypothetical protein